MSLSPRITNNNAFVRHLYLSRDSKMTLNKTKAVYLGLLMSCLLGAPVSGLAQTSTTGEIEVPNATIVLTGDHLLRAQNAEPAATTQNKDSVSELTIRERQSGSVTILDLEGKLTQLGKKFLAEL
jgi:hypothetical protein